LTICAVQCWARENLLVIDEQQAELTQTAKDQAAERQVAEGFYADFIGQAVADGDDEERLELARSYARFDRAQQEREADTDREIAEREETISDVILANGSLALKTCSGPVDGLCTGEVQEDYLKMYTRPQEQ